LQKAPRTIGCRAHLPRLALVVLLVCVTAAASRPAAGAEYSSQGGLDLLRIAGFSDFGKWMDAYAWEDLRPLYDPRDRFRIEDGALRLESRAESFIIGTELAEGLRKPIAEWPYLRFVVRVDEVPEGARLIGEERDDSAVRISTVYRRDPVQALVYVWSWELPVGQWSARSDKLFGDYRDVRRKSFGQGKPPEGRWLTVEVNLRRDFREQFPDQSLPVLQGIGLSSDSNNTGTGSLAWLRSITLHRHSLHEQGYREGDRLGDTRVWFR